MTKSWIRSLKFGFLAVGIYILGQLAQLPSIIFLEINKNKGLTGLQSGFSIGLYLLVIIVTFWLALRFKVVNIKEKLDLKRLAILVGAGEPSILLVSSIGILILLAMGDDLTSMNQAAINELMGLLPKSLMFIMIVIGAPIIEETIFRGFIPKMFCEKRQWLGLILGAILFGLAHVPTNLGSAVQYIGMGGVLSAVTYFGKRVEYSMVLHAIHNLVAFLLVLSELN